MALKNQEQKSRGFSFWGVALMAGLLAIVCMLPGNVQARNIKVGIIDCYSGPPAVFGKDALNGFKLAKELIMRENVNILVGTINSGAALAVSSYAKKAKVPFIVWISKSQKITGAEGHRYVFDAGENPAMALGAIGAGWIGMIIQLALIPPVVRAIERVRNP